MSRRACSSIPKHPLGLALLVLASCTLITDPDREPGPAAEVRIVPDSARLGRGETVELRAKVFDAHGRPVAGGVRWASSDTAVVTVSAQGVVRGVNGGSAWVVASAGAAADSVPARVVTPLAIHVASPSSDTVFSTPVETGWFQVSGTITSESPIAHATYSLDGGGEHPLPLGGTDARSRTWHVADSVAVGEHLLRIRAEDADGNREAFEWRVRLESGTRLYTARYLGTLGGADSEGADLNDRGEVVGSALDATGARRAFLWKDGTLVNLGEGMAPGSRATAISETGVVVGTEPGNCTRSFVWRSGERSILEQCGLTAVDVNDRGTILFAEEKVLRDGALVALESSTGEGMYAVMRVGPTDVVLGVIHGSCGGGFCSYGPMLAAPPYGPGDVTAFRYGGWAVDMDETGRVLAACGGGSAQHTCAGRVHHGGGKESFIRWKAPSPGSHGSVSAINREGQVIGRTDPGSGERPFLWEAGRFSRVEVQGGGWALDRLVEINGHGQILAHGHNAATGERGAVLLTPVP